MGQVTIYLDDETERVARAAAAAEKLPLSRWFARYAEQQRDTKRDWEALFQEADKHRKLWDAFPLTEVMHKDLPADTPRETW